MKITNAKEYDEAYARRGRLETKIDELYKEIQPLQHDLNQLEDDIQDYELEQGALDE